LQSLEAALAPIRQMVEETKQALIAMLSPVTEALTELLKVVEDDLGALLAFCTATEERLASWLASVKRSVSVAIDDIWGQCEAAVTSFLAQVEAMQEKVAQVF